MRKSPKLVAKVENVTYHRNGVGGRPFYTVVFKPTKQAECGTLGGNETPRMMATIPSDANSEEIFVVQLDDLEEQVGNEFWNWRSQNFFPELEKAIQKYPLGDDFKVQGAWWRKR